MQNKTSFRLKKVLLIEDVTENRLLLKAILKPFGCAFIEAETGEEALKIIDEQSDFDLFLIDIGLPKINGVDVSWRLREKGITAPIIIISAYLSKWDKEDIFDCGANEIIAKPFEKDQLLSAIERVFEKPSEEPA